MSDIAKYLSEVELALVSSAVVAQYQIIRSWAHTDDGYIRIRATLVNGDFLEAAEYFVISGEEIVTIDYRHQWMDASRGELRSRWDSTPHHPELENFPYHLHLGSEETVAPSQPIGIIALLRLLEDQLARH